MTWQGDDYACIPRKAGTPTLRRSTDRRTSCSRTCARRSGACLTSAWYRDPACCVSSRARERRRRAALEGVAGRDAARGRGRGDLRIRDQRGRSGGGARAATSSSIAYGAFAGNMALATLARGGVYVAGGIARRSRASSATGLRARLCDKGRFSDLTRRYPGAYGDRSESRPEGAARGRSAQAELPIASGRWFGLETRFSSAVVFDVAKAHPARRRTATSTTFSVAYHASILRAAGRRNAVRCGKTSPPAHAEHRMRLVAGARDGELAAVRLQCSVAGARPGRAGRKGDRTATVATSGCVASLKPACNPASGPAKPPIASATRGSRTAA